MLASTLHSSAQRNAVCSSALRQTVVGIRLHLDRLKNLIKMEPPVHHCISSIDTYEVAHGTVRWCAACAREGCLVTGANVSASVSLSSELTQHSQLESFNTRALDMTRPCARRSSAKTSLCSSGKSAEYHQQHGVAVALRGAAYSTEYWRNTLVSSARRSCNLYARIGSLRSVSITCARLAHCVHARTLHVDANAVACRSLYDASHSSGIFCASRTRTSCSVCGVHGGTVPLADSSSKQQVL
jgi:hypothetical protein